MSAAFRNDEAYGFAFVDTVKGLPSEGRDRLEAPRSRPVDSVFFICSHAAYRDFWAERMPDLDYIRAEIERMRIQVGRQRKEILQLQRAGLPTVSADALLQRMLDKIDALCEHREKLKAEQPRERRVLGGRKW